MRDMAVIRELMAEVYDAVEAKEITSRGAWLFSLDRIIKLQTVFS